MATPGNRLANLTQLKIAGTLVTASNSFPVLLPEDIRGSIRHVEDYIELTNISSIFLEPGQLAYIRTATINNPSGYYFVEDTDPSTPATRQSDGSLSNYKWSRFGLNNSSIVKVIDFTNQIIVTCAHNFGYNPTSIITDSSGYEIEAQVLHVNVNTIEITFNVNKSGRLTLK